jgi:hypothetical protein
MQTHNEGTHETLWETATKKMPSWRGGDDATVRSGYIFIRADLGPTAVWEVNFTIWE